MSKTTNETTDIVKSMLVSATESIFELRKHADKVASLAKVMAAFIDSKSKIFLTGVGKSGFIAEKNAATLRSLAIDAQFLCPMAAGHGDLGAIPAQQSTLLIAFSKSGKSKELHDMFKMIAASDKPCIVAFITLSSQDTYENVDMTMNFDVTCDELDGHGMLPSISNALFELIMSAACKVVVEHHLGLRAAMTRLKTCHPSGSLHDKVVQLLDTIESEASSTTDSRPDHD